MAGQEIKKKRGRAAVVVLGDLGRSPRMQYHALSLARQMLFKGFPDECDALKSLRTGALETGSSARWGTEWEEHAKPLISEVISRNHN